MSRATRLLERVRYDGRPVDLVAVEEVGSTNAEVAELARAGAPAGTVVVAEQQTAGRGRLDRGWTTPPRAAVLVSVLLRPTDLAPAAWPWLSLALGLGVQDALAELLGLPGAGERVQLKWPNDVQVRPLPGPAGDTGRPGKVAGLLAERVDTPQGPAAVLGVGLNVSTTAEELAALAPAAARAPEAAAAGEPGPDPLGPSPATSLLLEGGGDGPHRDRTAVLAAVLARLADRYRELVEHPGRLRRAYAERCATVGQEVRVLLPGDADLRGVAVGIDEHGRLQVRTPGEGPGGGEVRAVGAGDVVHVRPAAPAR